MRGFSFPLRTVLVGLALLTAAATIERVVGLSAPMPTAEAPTELRVEGYRVTPVAGEISPRQGRELSHGKGRRFRVLPLSGGEPYTLLLLPVRSRTGTEISEASKERKGLNFVAVAEEVPPFALKERRILSLPPAQGGGAGAKMDQVALGRGPADPEGSVTRLQTCLAPSGHAGVSASTLVGESQAIGPKGPRPALERRLRRFAGLQRARYECLAVQVERKGSDQQALVAMWKGAQRALEQYNSW